MTTESRVAAVVPAFEGGGMLVRCAAALLASSPRPPRVVIVANGNRDGACDAVSAAHGEELEIVRPAANLGFAGGVNLGIAHVMGSCQAPQVIVLVNQDCVVERPALTALTARLEDRSIGVAGALLIEADGRTLQHAGGIVHANGLTDHIGRGERLGTPRPSADPPSRSARRCDPDYVTGALFGFRVEVWRRFGPFDAGYYPAYFEEVDFCIRLAAAGYRIVCEPGARAAHLEGSASGGGSRLLRERYHRSRMRFAARHLLRGANTVRVLVSEAAWLARQRSWREVGPAVAAYPTLVRELRARPRSPRGGAATEVKGR